MSESCLKGGEYTARGEMLIQRMENEDRPLYSGSTTGPVGFLKWMQDLMG